MEGLEELRPLGHGAFGEVVLARRSSDRTLCAVKHIRRMDMSDSEVKEHVAEVRVLQSLCHPCILRYLDSNEDDKTLHIVTEYADAGDLQQLMKREADAGRLLEAVVLLALFTQLLTAIAHVHANRVMHRDLKPANVFLTTTGIAKLGDFGVAKVLAGTTVCNATCVGSPTYMAPEIVAGEPYGPPCDVWSLGVIFYELCTFKKPFEGRSLGELIMRISSGAYPPMDGVRSGPGSASLSATMTPLLDRMLVVEARERAPTAEVIRSPVLEMFVASMRTCAACLQSVFRSGNDGNEMISQDVASVAEQASELELAGTMALQTAEAESLASSSPGSRRGAAAAAAANSTDSSLSAAVSPNGTLAVPSSSKASSCGRPTSSNRGAGRSTTFASSDSLALSATSTLGNALAAASVPGGGSDTQISFALTTTEAVGPIVAGGGGSAAGLSSRPTTSPSSVASGPPPPQSAKRRQEVPCSEEGDRTIRQVPEEEMMGATLRVTDPLSGDSPAFAEPCKGDGSNRCVLNESFDASYMREVFGEAIDADDAKTLGATTLGGATIGCRVANTLDEEDTFGQPEKSELSGGSRAHGRAHAGSVADNIGGNGGSARSGRRHVAGSGATVARQRREDSTEGLPRLAGAGGCSSSGGSTPSAGGSSRGGGATVTAGGAAPPAVGGPVGGRHASLQHVGQSMMGSGSGANGTCDSANAGGVSGSGGSSGSSAPAQHSRHRAEVVHGGRKVASAGDDHDKSATWPSMDTGGNERSGALVMTFFDTAPGEPLRAPPQALLDSLQAHDLRQKMRAKQKVAEISPPHAHGSLHPPGSPGPGRQTQRRVTPERRSIGARTRNSPEYGGGGAKGHQQGLGGSSSAPTLHGPPSTSGGGGGNGRIQHHLMRPVRATSPMAGPTGNVRTRHR